MKVTIISDLHGKLIPIEKTDILIICGDSCIDLYQYNFIFNDFVPWLNNIDALHIFMIGGNHDVCFEHSSFKHRIESATCSKVTYLQDELHTFNFEDKEYKIYGTPWCKQFGNWAFMLPDDDLKQKFNMIPHDLDFLITHDAPYGYSDQPLGLGIKEHRGNKFLTDAILEKQPKFHFHGHFHSGKKGEMKINNTSSYNASILNEQYLVAYSPIILNL